MDTEKMARETTKELLQFIGESPDCFHAAEAQARRLRAEGFTELCEAEPWDLKEGGRYFVTRNQSSLIAFKIGRKDFKSFHIIASHSDSPTFKIKENPELEAEGWYGRLNVEKYGGMLCAPWFDRPLSVSGRLAVRTERGIEMRLVNADRDLLMIPSLAIHMNRSVNDGYKYSIQKDMIPMYAGGEGKGTFMELVAESAGVSQEDVLGHDLFLYSRMPGTIWGAREEFVSSPRLDDLQCAFASLKGFLRGSHPESISVHAVFDNEEVGSCTRQGADSTFLEDVLGRINSGLGRSRQELLQALASSFMISADNAHAVHPNQGEKADPVNRPLMNRGIVIKYHGGQKYTTDAVSAAVFKEICRRAEVPFQTFTNHSDIPGGSTLGNLSSSHVAVRTVDVGLPQLAMHSPYETAGVYDTWYFVRAAEEFFSSCLRAREGSCCLDGRR